jgi:hypothetical protein
MSYRVNGDKSVIANVRTFAKTGIELNSIREVRRRFCSNS